MDGTALLSSVQSKRRRQAAFRPFLPHSQVMRYEYYKRQFTALSLLSPFLYLKTVASVLATLYNSPQCTVF
jgi:hypothetical protein